MKTEIHFLYKVLRALKEANTVIKAQNDGNTLVNVDKMIELVEKKIEKAEKEIRP